MTTKFGKQVHLCVDPNENNQAGAGDVITSRICDQLKLFCVYYHSAYGHQFFSIVTNFEQLLAMFLHPLVYPLVTWSCKIIWQIKNIFSLLPQCLWPTQCLWLTLHQTGQGWLTMRGFCPQSHMNLESGDLTWKNKKHISTTIMPMAIKLCRRLLFITSHDHILRRSCKIAWQTKIIVYPLSQCLRLLCICTSDKWWLTMRSFHPQNYTTLWTRSHVRPNDKSKASPLPQCLGPKIISAFIKTLEIKLLPLPAVKLFTLGKNLANQVWYS